MICARTQICRSVSVRRSNADGASTGGAFQTGHSACQLLEGRTNDHCSKPTLPRSTRPDQYRLGRYCYYRCTAHGCQLRQNFSMRCRTCSNPFRRFHLRHPHPPALFTCCSEICLIGWQTSLFRTLSLVACRQRFPLALLDAGSSSSSPLSPFSTPLVLPLLSLFLYPILHAFRDGTG